MAGEGRPPTTLLRGMKKRRGWPTSAGHDMGGSGAPGESNSLGGWYYVRPPLNAENSGGPQELVLGRRPGQWPKEHCPDQRTLLPVAPTPAALRGAPLFPASNPLRCRPPHRHGHDGHANGWRQVGQAFLTLYGVLAARCAARHAAKWCVGSCPRAGFRPHRPAWSDPRVMQAAATAAPRRPARRTHARSASARPSRSSRSTRSTRPRRIPRTCPAPGRTAPPRQHAVSSSSTP